MTSTTETEILSIISEDDFKKLLGKLRKKHGMPKETIRLAIQCTDYTYQDIDTRIRITDGKAEIVQKVGGWDAKSRVELVTPLAPSVDVVLNAYQTIRNLLKGNEIETSIIQLKSFIFEYSDFEIKLTHQFGKKDVYNYEVEVFNGKLTPLEIASKFEMPINTPENTPEFWKRWNKTVNLSADRLSDTELRSTIANYL